MSVTRKKILSRNVTLSMFLVILRTILWGQEKNTDFDDCKSKSDSEESDSICEESDL